MLKLESSVSPSSPEFRRNQARMLALVAELRERTAQVQLGGGEKYLQRHREQGKLPVRERIEKLLDPFVLLIVNINAESRVKVSQGEAKPELMEGGTRQFLVKVENQAGVTAPPRVESPNSGPTSLKSQIGRAHV